MIVTILVVLGLALGSFINALVWRLHLKRDWVKERSVCPNCEHVLAPLDLVPIVSWLALRGRCRYCQKPISWQYPMVEALTAGLFVGSYLWWPQPVVGHFEWLRLAVWLVALAGLVAAAVYDLRWMILPDSLMYPLLVLAVSWVAVAAVFLGGGTNLVKDSLVGLMIGGGLFYVIFQLSDGRWIGGGDVKLGFLMGLLLGARDALTALYAGCLAGAVVMGALLLSGRATRKSKVPFGPFLIAGLVIGRLFGATFWHWYKAKLL